MLPTSSSCQSGLCAPLTTQPRSLRKPGRYESNMDLNYVTERIIALWFPTNGTPGSYRQGQRQVAHMLHSKHGDNYMVSKCIFIPS